MTRRILNSTVLAIVAGLSMALFSGWIRSNYDKSLFVTEDPAIQEAGAAEPDSIFPGDSTTLPGIKSIR